MTELYHLDGYIRGVKYRAYLAGSLVRVPFDSFDINRANASGLIDLLEVNHNSNLRIEIGASN